MRTGGRKREEGEEGCEGIPESERGKCIRCIIDIL